MTEERHPSLDELDARLKAARAERAAAGGRRRAPLTGMGLALRIAVELVSALAVALGIGWLLDRWLGTRPWIMLAFLPLGGAGGMLNVYRLSVRTRNDVEPGTKDGADGDTEGE